MIARVPRLLIVGGFLAAAAHVTPLLERAALGIARIEDLAPEAVARPVGRIRAACRIDRLARRSQTPGGDPCDRGEPPPGARAQPPGTLPDPALTPGAIRTTDRADVCADRRTAQYRHWTRARDDRILVQSGLPPGPHPDYEVDHLIPLDLGGADEDKNLWPEPRRSIEPVWNAERKDRLEWRMAELVCSSALDLTTAQKEISSDWILAFRKYLGEPARS